MLANHAKKNKYTMLATWVEMSLVCQIQTGIRFAPDYLDLRSQEAAFRTIVKRNWSLSRFTVNGKVESTKYVWRPVP